MVSSVLSPHSAAIEEIVYDPAFQQWLYKKGWILAAPDNDWHYWHLELGDGSILPVTKSILLKLYLKDR